MRESRVTSQESQATGGERVTRTSHLGVGTLGAFLQS